MNTELTHPATDSPSPPASPASLPIAAEQPDAAPKPGDDKVRLACHVIALVALVALLAYCVISAPARRGDSTAARPAPHDLTSAETVHTPGAA